MVARAEELDVEEGLEEALDSLSLDHVTQVRDHVISATPPVDLSSPGTFSAPPCVQRPETQYKGECVVSCDCHMTSCDPGSRSAEGSEANKRP